MNNILIFCFTFAGGTASFFDRIEKDLHDYRIIKLEYAGHGKRYNECFYHSFKELAIDLYDVVKSHYNGEKYALFGYSMGTISLIEVLKLIVSENQMPLPCNVFLAAHEPFTKAELIGYESDELDEWVKQRTIKFGGVPESLIDNNSFWRMYLPLYRSDYSLIGNYKFEELDFKTNIPATVFYSETDTRLDKMRGWGKYFYNHIDYFRFEGNHFFINDHHEKMAEIIKSQMNRSSSNDI